MKPVISLLLGVTLFLFGLAGRVATQPSADPLVEGFRLVEVASVADAMEQLYGKRGYMNHDMRPLFTTKFAGPAVTVLLRKEEHTEGALPGLLDSIDRAPAGSVYVMVMTDGLDFAGIGGLIGTALKVRGVTAALVDGSVRDVPQLKRLQFPVFARGTVPSTTVNHYKLGGVDIAVTCAGVVVNPGDIITADEDGVVVVPRAQAAAVLKKAQELDELEHRTYPFIEKYRSLKEAVAKLGRI